MLNGFQTQRKFLLITTKATKPEPAVYQDLLKPTNEALMAAVEVKDSNRADPMYTQLSAVADGVMMLAWVTVENRPYKHVEETLGSAQFFGNRVLKEQKDKLGQTIAHMWRLTVMTGTPNKSNVSRHSTRSSKTWQTTPSRISLPGSYGMLKESRHKTL